jgi:hypothetical protein
VSRSLTEEAIGAAQCDNEALDAHIEQRMSQRIEWNAAPRTALLTGLLAYTLRSAPLSAADRLLVSRSMFTTFQEIVEQQVDVRMQGADTRHFTLELDRAAADEALVVEEADDSEFGEVSLCGLRGDGGWGPGGSVA